MRVKHTAKLRCNIMSGKRVVDTSEDIDPYLMGAHETVRCIMFNALGVSGGTLWRHPTTGEMFPGGLKFHWELMNPDDELTGDDECDCSDCVREEVNAS